MFNDMPPFTRNLLWANVIVFLLQQFLGEAAFFDLMLWPLGEVPQRLQMLGVDGFMPWQIVTYAFLHGDFMHLLVNMFGVWMFGSQVERVWGQQRFTIFYFVCVVGAGLTQLVVATLSVRNGGGFYPTIGASGGVFGILLAFALLFPNARIMPLFLPIPIKAPVFVAVYGAMELFFGVTGTVQGVAHFAHLGGMVFGFLLIQYWRGKPPFSRRRRPPTLH
ncbi:MAG: rhomboid family intramembrane serine protease [Lysobacteraceae bacterium]